MNNSRHIHTLYITSGHNKYNNYIIHVYSAILYNTSYNKIHNTSHIHHYIYELIMIKQPSFRRHQHGNTNLKANTYIQKRTV